MPHAGIEIQAHMLIFQLESLQLDCCNEFWINASSS